jgi:hypothetical protein
MPETETGLAHMRHSTALNEAQRRRLIVTCEYIDKLLGDVEEILHQPSSLSPFPRHVVDMSPEQARGLEEHIGRLREQLLRTLAWQRMKPEPAEIPASRAVLTHLNFIDIAIEELRPRYMRGSGALAEGAAEELNRVADELGAVARAMERYLRRELEKRTEPDVM